MRFLGIGKDGSLGDMYLHLSRAGHEVKAYIGDPDWQGILRGMIQRTDDWKGELDWIRGGDGIILFEAADSGDLQDSLRRDGFHVIGGSAVGDRMENDRDFGQSCMRQAGMRTAPSQDFHDFDTALEFIRRRPRRYVFKLSGLGYGSSSKTGGGKGNGADTRAPPGRHKKNMRVKFPPPF